MEEGCREFNQGIFSQGYKLSLGNLVRLFSQYDTQKEFPFSGLDHSDIEFFIQANNKYFQNIMRIMNEKIMSSAETLLNS